MFVSTRKKFRKGDTGWAEYQTFIGLPALREVRSIDRALNDYVEDCGSFECSAGNMGGALGMLPYPKSEDEYCLLAVELPSGYEPDPREWTLLGHDLSDETHTSSSLNCGPWRGELEALTERLNQYGLLSKEDAELAQRLLPEEWGEEEPHAHVTIWALYERRMGV